LILTDAQYLRGWMRFVMPVREVTHVIQSCHLPIVLPVVIAAIMLAVSKIKRIACVFNVDNRAL